MKRIVVCCDGMIVLRLPNLQSRSLASRFDVDADVCPSGTWLDASMGLSNGKLPIPSNVTRISEAIKPMSSRGIHQVVFYQAGIGSTGNIFNRVIGG